METSRSTESHGEAVVGRPRWPAGSPRAAVVGRHVAGLTFLVIPAPSLGQSYLLAVDYLPQGWPADVAGNGGRTPIRGRTRMDIAIIGAGNVGRALATFTVRVGHSVVISVPPTRRTPGTPRAASEPGQPRPTPKPRGLPTSSSWRCRSGRSTGSSTNSVPRSTARSWMSPIGPTPMTRAPSWTAPRPPRRSSPASRPPGWSRRSTPRSPLGRQIRSLTGCRWMDTTPRPSGLFYSWWSRWVRSHRRRPARHGTGAGGDGLAQHLAEHPQRLTRGRTGGSSWGRPGRSCSGDMAWAHRSPQTMITRGV